MSGTGTLRQNRVQKCPVSDVAVMKKQARGTVDFRCDTNAGIIITRWNDNSVTLGSTYFGVAPKGQVSRWSKSERKIIQIPIPNNIVMYNQNMGGTDRMDENIAYYRPNIRIRKWWWPLFLAQLSYAMHNAWQLYRLSAAMKNQPLDLLGFTRNVAMSLMYTNKPPSIQAGRLPTVSKRVPDHVRFDIQGHFITSGLTQRTCVQCGKKTMKLCSKCPSAPLHQDCFIAFHTK